MTASSRTYSRAIGVGILLAIIFLLARALHSAGDEPRPGAPQTVPSTMQAPATEKALSDLLAQLAQAPHRSDLSNAQDIERARVDAAEISIRFLPLEDYPLLKKFTKAEEIYLSGPAANATDRNLEAIASLKFPRLYCVNASQCRAVTDKGVKAILSLPSITELGLESTSITDSSCELMAHDARIKAVNIMDCKGVTLKGLQAFSESKFLDELSFSNNGLTTGEVIELLQSFKKLSNCQILDLRGSLDEKSIVAAGKKNNIEVLLRHQSTEDAWRAVGH